MSLLCTIQPFESRDFGPGNARESAVRPVKSFDTVEQTHYNSPGVADTLSGWLRRRNETHTGGIQCITFLRI
jgi:hypothetical protein